MSPRSGKSNDNQEILIDFTSPELSQTSPVSDVAVADGGEFLLVGPNFTSTRCFDGVTFGKFPRPSKTASPASDVAVTERLEIPVAGVDYAETWPSDGGMFGEFPKPSQTTLPASGTAVADDGEILLASPNFSWTRPFLDGGKFGKLPPEIGIRSRTNPFLADILASSNGVDTTASDGVGLLAADGRLVHDGYSTEDHLLTVFPDTGTGVASRRSPFTRRGISPSLDQSVTSLSTCWSPGSAEGTSMLSFRPQDATADSHPLVVSIPPDAGAAAAAHVMYETSLDTPVSSASPVAFVVS